jgi:hypothetical protein
LRAEANALQFAVPGGLIGVGTALDPALCRGDRLVGHVLGRLGAMPPVWVATAADFKVTSVSNALRGSKWLHSFAFVKPLVAAASGVTGDTNPLDSGRIAKLGKSETLMVTIGSTNCAAHVVGKPGKPGGKQTARPRLLRTPVGAERGEVVVLSRQVQKQWRLVGRGAIVGGFSVAGYARATRRRRPSAAAATTTWHKPKSRHDSELVREAPSAPLESLPEFTVELRASPTWSLTATAVEAAAAVVAIRRIEAAMAMVGGSCSIRYPLAASPE